MYEDLEGLDFQGNDIVTVHLRKSDGLISLRVRAEGEGALGDAQFDVRPGESMFGKSYDEWAALPDGPHEVS